MQGFMAPAAPSNRECEDEISWLRSENFDTTTPDGVYFDFDVKWFGGGDAVVTITHGEGSWFGMEGAPVPVHAVYSSTGNLEQAIEPFVTAVRERIDAEGWHPDILTDFKDAYDARVALGMGEWIKGDNIIAGRGRVVDQIFLELHSPATDAYSIRDPKHPDYFDHLIDSLDQFDEDGGPR